MNAVRLLVHPLVYKWGGVSRFKCSWAAEMEVPAPAAFLSGGFLRAIEATRGCPNFYMAFECLQNGLNIMVYKLKVMS